MDESLSRCSFYDIGLLVGGISHLPTNALILLMETLRVEEENERNRGGAQIGLEKDVGGLRGVRIPFGGFAVNSAHMRTYHPICSPLRLSELKFHGISVGLLQSSTIHVVFFLSICKNQKKMSTSLPSGWEISPGKQRYTVAYYVMVIKNASNRRQYFIVCSFVRFFTARRTK